MSPDCMLVIRRIGVVVLLGVIGLSGCSFATVQRPPDAWTSGEPLECTSSKAAPTTDVLVGGLLAVPSSIYLIGASAACRGLPCPEGVRTGAYVALGAIAASIPFLVSGAFGQGWVKECRRLECISGVEDSCEKPGAAPPASPAGKPPEPLPSGAGEGTSPG
jgi:hypothetical protein